MVLGLADVGTGGPEKFEGVASARPAVRKRVAVVMVGAFRTLVEPQTRSRFHNHLFKPLERCAQVPYSK
eukprot:5223790-Pyramimonas_sp.AAC.1